MNYMVHVSSRIEELKIDHLTPLLVVTIPCSSWFLWRADYVGISNDVFIFNLGLRFEAKSRLKGGIEDFNLDAWGSEVARFSPPGCSMIFSLRVGSGEGATVPYSVGILHRDANHR